MKKYQLILVLSLLGFCFTEDQDQCFTEFETKLRTECTKLNESCVLTDYSEKCIYQNDNCHNGDGDEYICNRIFPTNYPQTICQYDTNTKTCEKYEPTCNDYNTLNYFNNYVNFGENPDYCSKLKAGTGKTCHLSDVSKSCTAYFDSCSNLLTGVCEENLPSDFQKICDMGSGTAGCQPVERVCNRAIYDVTEEQCHKLKASSIDQACIYSDGYCIEKYIDCEKIPQSSCTSFPLISPLINQGSNNYVIDDTKKCFYNTDESKCKSIPRICEEYDGDDEEKCHNLNSSDQSKKRCIFDSTRTPNKCYSEYKTCKNYNDNEPSKYGSIRGSGCEGIKLREENQKCIYIRENDTCITGRIYSTCEDYDGSDKYTCESIKSNKTNAYCVLTSDSKCVERKDANITCEEAFDKEDCVFYAKPVDTRKKCIYSGNTCREVFKRCEDSYEATSDNCSDIKLYNGKECYFESNLCRSKDKVCEEADNEDECYLISKTGVSNPDKKVCDFISGYCRENYKFCSDYRGSNIATCQSIKPYDKSGSYVDLTSICELDDNNRCQRVSKDCSAADGNPIRCSIISQKIKDNHKYHCVYKNGECIKRNKKCEDLSTFSECEDNIPEDYLTSYCVWDNNNNECVTKKKCHAFKEEYHTDLCNAIKPNCLYDNINGCHEEKEDVCEKKVFFTKNDGNKAICESIEVSSPNKLCTINEDNTACIEIFKNLTSSDNTSVGNSAEFLMKGIQFITIILSLLIFI